LERTLESLEEVLSELESSGVRLALQNEVSGFVESFVQMSDILSLFDNDLIGVCFDPANVLHNESVSDWRQLLKDKIFTVHLRNFSQKSQAGCAWNILDGFGGSINRLKKLI
jgi:sugar phosphate isomerase/epimerase